MSRLINLEDNEVVVFKQVSPIVVHVNELLARVQQLNQGADGSQGIEYECDGVNEK